jgi:hypothetical protein
MDYLVDFNITVPEGTPASELEQRTTGEPNDPAMSSAPAS